MPDDDRVLADPARVVCLVCYKPITVDLADPDEEQWYCGDACLAKANRELAAEIEVMRREVELERATAANPPADDFDVPY